MLSIKRKEVHNVCQLFYIELRWKLFIVCSIFDIHDVLRFGVSSLFDGPMVICCSISQDVAYSTPYVVTDITIKFRNVCLQ